MAQTVTRASETIGVASKLDPKADDTLGHRSTTTLVVENMHCGGCIRKAETALTSVPGVVSARANLSTKRVIVTHVADAAGVIAFVDALTASGFRASALAETIGRPAMSADQDYLKRLAVAGFAAAIIMLLSVSVWSGANGDMPASLQSLAHWSYASARLAYHGWIC